MAVRQQHIARREIAIAGANDGADVAGVDIPGCDASECVAAVERIPASIIAANDPLNERHVAIA